MVLWVANSPSRPQQAKGTRADGNCQTDEPNDVNRPVGRPRFGQRWCGAAQLPQNGVEVYGSEVGLESDI